MWKDNNCKLIQKFIDERKREKNILIINLLIINLGSFLTQLILSYFRLKKKKSKGTPT